MNVFIWMVCGALLGWIAYSRLNMSPGRGQAASLVIGATGGVVGGKLLAPLFGIAGAVPDAFSAAALSIAALTASGLLLIGNYVYDTWEV
jgi:uncharacterized membrane protein YeaQ/YmgE (transglycosylase-associated protein family)